MSWFAGVGQKISEVCEPYAEGFLNGRGPVDQRKISSAQQITGGASNPALETAKGLTNMAGSSAILLDMLSDLVFTHSVSWGTCAQFTAMCLPNVWPVPGRITTVKGGIDFSKVEWVACEQVHLVPGEKPIHLQPINGQELFNPRISGDVITQQPRETILEINAGPQLVFPQKRPIDGCVSRLRQCVPCEVPAKKINTACAFGSVFAGGALIAWGGGMIACACTTHLCTPHFLGVCCPSPACLCDMAAGASLMMRGGDCLKNSHYYDELNRGNIAFETSNPQLGGVLFHPQNAQPITIGNKAFALCIQRLERKFSNGEAYIDDIRDFYLLLNEPDAVSALVEISKSVDDSFYSLSSTESNLKKDDYRAFLDALGICCASKAFSEDSKTAMFNQLITLPVFSASTDSVSNGRSSSVSEDFDHEVLVITEQPRGNEIILEISSGSDEEIDMSQGTGDLLRSNSSEGLRRRHVGRADPQQNSNSAEW